MESFKAMISKLSSSFKIIKAYLFSKSLEESGYKEEIALDLSKHIWPSVKIGLVVIAVSFGIFVVWGSLAPLDSATIAQGYVKLGKNRKVIQHLEGGIIEKIFVEDGDIVEKGQKLLVLNDTSARSNLQNLRAQLWHLKAIEARLFAEEQGVDQIEFDSDLLEADTVEADKSMKSQASLFKARKKEIEGQLNSLKQQVIQTQEQISGLEAQLKSTATQIVLTEDELEGVQKLYKKGLAIKEQFLNVQRRKEDLEGRRGEIKSKIATAKESIAEIKVRMLSVENQYRREASSEYKDIYSRILDIKERMGAAGDVLKRTTITAPRAGIVTGLEYHTVGGVIPPGGKILEIVPQDDKLIVEAMVQPQDIDNVYVGLKAKVQLNAYKTRVVPRVEGTVIYLSADSINDERMGAYYLARIEISESAIEQINADVKLYPGMPATVFIVQGTRTFLQFLLSPIRDSFHQAFKEA